MLNKDIIQGNWKIAKGKLKQQWEKLTDDDITHLKGTHDELEGFTKTIWLCKRTSG